MSEQNNEELKKLDALFAELGKESGIAPSSVGAPFGGSFPEPEGDLSSLEGDFDDVTADAVAEDLPEAADEVSDVELEIDEMLKDLDGEVVDSATGETIEEDYLDLSSTPAEAEPAAQPEPESAPMPAPEEAVLPVEEFVQPEPALEEAQEQPAAVEEVAVEEPAPVPVDDEMAGFLQELEAAETPSAEQTELSEAPTAEAESTGAPAADEMDDFFAGADELAPLEEAAAEATPAGESSLEETFADLSTEFEAAAGGADAFSLEEEAPAAEVAPEEFGEAPIPAESPDEAFATPEEALLGPPELTDEDLLRIQNKIFTFTPNLQDKTRRCIVEDLLPETAQHTLVRMLLADKSAEEIKSFIEQSLGEQIVEAPAEEFLEADIGVGVPARKPSHALENIMPMLRIGALLTGVVLLGVLIFLFVIKPHFEGKDLYTQGLSSLRAGNYFKAEDYFRRGVTRVGKDLEWYHKYGTEYLKKKEYGRALKKFKAGLQLEKNNFKTLISIANTYTAAGDFKNALSGYSKLLKVYPDNLLVLEKIGDLYIDLGDKKKNPLFYKEAKKYYLRIINKKWTHLNGQFKMLLTYIKQQKLPEAKEKYRQIKRIDENAINVPVMTELGAFYQKHKMWYDSYKVLKQVLDYDGQYAKARYFMSSYFRDQEDYERALKQAELALEHDKRNAVYCNQIGELNMLFDKPNTSIAQTYFKKASQIDPGFYRPYVNLGDIYFANLISAGAEDIKLADNNFRNALENYEKAWAFLPNNYFNQRYLYRLGWLYYRKGKHSLGKAMEKWKLAYDKNPFHPIISFAMGSGYLHLKQDNLAIAEFRKIIRYYEVIRKRFNQILPYRKRHVNVVRALSWTYNNIGVGYLFRFQRTKDKEWERQALLAFWKTRELAEKISGASNSGLAQAKNNISYILRPNVKNRGLSIAPAKTQLPSSLYFEKH